MEGEGWQISEVVDGGLYNEARANAEANLKAMFAAALGDQAELTVVFREAERRVPARGSRVLRGLAEI